MILPLRIPDEARPIVPAIAFVTTFQIYTLDSAPEGSRPPLEGLGDRVGFLPNLAATMEGSPALIRGFVSLQAAPAGGSLTELERQVVALGTAYENRCTYCMAFHSTLAAANGLEEDELDRIRRGDDPSDARLRALFGLARALTSHRGHLSTDEVGTMAGDLEPAEFLEVIAQIGSTTLASLTHNLTGATLDEAFHPRTWKTN
jgi:AhpD family alkylhydroperoxidase